MIIDTQEPPGVCVLWGGGGGGGGLTELPDGPAVSAALLAVSRRSLTASVGLVWLLATPTNTRSFSAE